MAVSSAIEEAKGLVKDRLSELEVERKSLEKALTALSPNGSGPARRPRGSRPGRPKGTRKGGTRRDHLLDLVKENPGIGASEAAKRLKIKPNYLYRVIGDLVKTKQLKKDGRKLYAV